MIRVTDYERPERKQRAFTAWPKIHYQIFGYGRSIFCRLDQPNFSDIFDWVSVVRDQRACKISRNRPVQWQGNKVQTLYRQDSPKQANAQSICFLKICFECPQIFKYTQIFKVYSKQFWYTQMSQFMQRNLTFEYTKMILSIRKKLSMLKKFEYAQTKL